jgi:hypothetical protein
MRLLLFFSLILVLSEAVSVPSEAGDKRAPAAASPPQPATPGKKRGKSLEFDDNVVEGMNKNPLDSLQNVGREDGKSHGRLYKKRTDFQNEIRQSVQEAGYSP